MEKKIKFVEGKTLNFREVEVSDAPFILSLRLNEKLSRFISKVENNLKKQEDWIKRYKTLGNEYYFVVESKDGIPYGTFRIYDIKGDSFGIGSWLMREDAPKHTALEGYFLAHDLCFYRLGFKDAHFDVRKENKSVVNFHKRMAAKIVREDDLNYYFILTLEDYEKNKSKYKRYIYDDKQPVNLRNSSNV